MSAMSQLIRFSLPRSSKGSGAFKALRERVSSTASAKTQYFGYALQNEGFPVPKPDNEMCWFIQWPPNSSYRTSEEFKRAVESIADGPVRTLQFEFQETKDGELVKGLGAPVCQFLQRCNTTWYTTRVYINFVLLAIINVIASAPRLKSEFERSMHKTFTDCYLAEGFTGGGWSYALNSNHADGAVIFDVKDLQTNDLEESEKRLAYYVIGWESLEAHHEYAKTALFDEEIDKLKGWFTSGSGAFYVKFDKHT